MIRRLLASLLFVVAFLLPAHAKTEFGKLGAAEYRIDVPSNWNHGLVVYCHGYDQHPGGVGYDERKPLPPELEIFVKNGYALAQSGYSAGGWAIEQAMPDIEALRKYFVDHYGKPKDTYITGHSLGGLLTVATIEKYPEVYDGGLDLCGVASSAPVIFSRAFDARILFDYYFPGALPSPVKVPTEYQLNDHVSKAVFDRLQAKPASSAIVRRVTGTHNNQDLAATIVFITYMLKDIEERAKGNPFDNRNTIYTGTPDDNALNDGVKRYAASAGALSYLERYVTLTGHLTRPVLAIHTTYDPLVPPQFPNEYSLLARESGAGEFFVQQYVKHDGHCKINAEETQKGFLQLKQWKEKHQAPKAGWLR